MKWIDIQKQQPEKGIRVLACDEYGFIDIEDTEDTVNRYAGRQTWFESYEYGNGTKIVAWAPLPKWPKKLCNEDADGAMP